MLENDNYSIQQCSNVPNIGTPHFPTMEDLFPTLECRIFQHWYDRVQRWIFRHSNTGQSITNIGILHIPTLDYYYQHWDVILSSVGENVSNIGYMNNPTLENSFPTLDH